MTTDGFEDYDSTAPDAPAGEAVAFDASLEIAEPQTDRERELAEANAALAEARQRLAEVEAREARRLEDPVAAAVDAPRHRVPDSAPRPQDRLSKGGVDRRSSEARGKTVVLTMFDHEFRIDEAQILDSWDFQLGATANNPLMMVRGLLGNDEFMWFAMKARAAGMTPIQASSEIMSMWREASGFGGAEGN